LKKLTFLLFIFILTGCVSTKKKNLQINKELTVKQMQQDINFIESKLFKMHPDVNWYISKEELISKFDSLEKSLTTPLKPNDFFLKLAPIIADVKQGHMSLNVLNEQIEKKDKKKYRYSKSPFSQLDFLWKDNHLYVLNNHSKNQNLQAGSIVLDINGISPQKYYSKYRNTITSDGFNETFIEKWFEKKISSYYTGDLGIVDSLQIRISCADSISNQTVYRIFKNPKKTKQHVEKNLDSLSQFKKDSILTIKKSLSKKQQKAEKDSLKSIKRKNQIYGYNPNTKKNTIELNYPTQDSTFAVLKVRGFGGTKYKKAYEAIFEEIKQKEIQNLVLDLRGNTGGRLNEINELYTYLSNEETFTFLNPTIVTSKWKLPLYMNAGRTIFHYIIFSPVYLVQSPFIVLNTRKNSKDTYHYKLKQEKPQSRKDTYYSGELFVLIDGLSFSASAIISSNLKGTKRATFIGNETGGTYNGTVAGRLPVLRLPNSKLPWRLGVMSLKPYQQTVEFGHGVRPDVTIIPTTEQIINKEDPEMDWILNKLNLRLN